MSLVNTLIQNINVKRLSQIDSFSERGEEIQKNILLELLRAGEETEWGARYGYSTIRSYSSYVDRVRVQSYDTLVPFIERMVAGEESVLWPGLVKWFAQSSGTTAGKSKFIPISDLSLEECHYRAGKDVQAIYFKNHPESPILGGKSLALGGSRKVSSLSEKTITGDLSAILIDNMPFWTHFFRTPNPDVILIPEFETKLDKIFEVCYSENVTSFAGVPSWILVMIKHILAKSGKDNLLEVWPNLELFVHGGVKFTPYREQYEKLIPSDKMNYMETYNASEGFFALQDSPEVEGMLLMLDLGIFYEFIDMSTFGTSNEKIVPLWEVTMGVNYAMVITTNGGLWRYLIGDTVRFVNMNPHRIVITGRTKHYINAFGEELIVDNAEQAIAVVCKSHRVSIAEYSAGPVFMDSDHRGRHEWVIEFAKEPDSLEQFASDLDKALQVTNSDYEAKRHNNATLDQLTIVLAPKGTFQGWMKERGKLGGQNKVPRLSNDRAYIDSIITYISKRSV